MSQADNQDKQTKALEAFWKAAKEGASRLVDEASTWSGPDARFYRAEGRVVMEHISPLYWGLATGSFLFITFRIAGSKRFQTYRDLYLYGAPVPHNPPSSTKQQWKSLLDRQTEEKADLASDLTRLPLDLFVSILGGCSSILWLSKPEKLQNDFIASPLTPGKSLIHSCVCPVFEEAYNKQDESVFEGGGGVEMLTTFDAFVKNCRIRSEFIQRQAAQGNQSDVVPYPGLHGASIR
jgi:hypothetical protein